MSSIADIEAAIEKLPPPEVDQLAQWLERHRMKRATAPEVESWLQRARGAAIPGIKTEQIMAFTRGEE